MFAEKGLSMRWYRKPTNIFDWHRVFAFVPHELTFEPGHWIWLEMVWRRFDPVWKRLPTPNLDHWQYCDEKNIGRFNDMPEVEQFQEESKTSVLLTLAL